MLSGGPYAEWLKPASHHKQEAPQLLGGSGVGGRGGLLSGAVGWGEGVDGVVEPSASDALFLAAPSEWRRGFNQRER